METGKREKIIGIWLMLGVFMLMVQIFLGGVTRLTGSGLSITEWDAIMGFLPPLNPQEWHTAFEKYKQIDQFRLVNSTFTLHDFKNIFFWEYIHRLWARLMALCAFVPMIYFIIKQILKKQDIVKLLLIIALGGLAGVMGWIMVASGLEKNKVVVNPVKLMMHLLIACLIVGLTFRFALGYLYPDQQIKTKQTNLILLLLIAVFVQIGFGALVAGAGAAYNCTTFPLMHGAFIPDNLGIRQPYENFIHENNITLQFIHRMTAYSIAIFGTMVFFVCSKMQAVPQFHTSRKVMLFAIFIQIGLGVATLFFTQSKIPVFWAELHQLGAFAVMFSVIGMHYFEGKREMEVRVINNI
jgi:cytochrome c oxidase assembly protein subunit 15